MLIGFHFVFPPYVNLCLSCITDACLRFSPAWNAGKNVFTACFCSISLTDLISVERPPLTQPPHPPPPTPPPPYCHSASFNSISHLFSCTISTSSASAASPHIRSLFFCAHNYLFKNRACQTRWLSSAVFTWNAEHRSARWQILFIFPENLGLIFSEKSHAAKTDASRSRDGCHVPRKGNYGGDGWQAFFSKKKICVRQQRRDEAWKHEMWMIKTKVLQSSFADHFPFFFSSQVFQFQSEHFTCCLAFGVFKFHCVKCG